MQDLTLVGVHDDGEHLVLTGPDGQRFRVQVDEPLRAAVRRDRARLGQLQIEMDGRLRPRDIQARIRSGQTADEVASAAGLPIEHVRRFEGPVLAEREFVARQARSVRIRRDGASATSPTLGDLVGERLAAREVDEAGTSWDAWRSDEGAWTVCLTFTAGGKQRRARWTYDTQLRHVTAVDDEARWLTDESSAAGPLPPRRLAPVRDGSLTSGPALDRVYDVEADGGVRPADGERAVAAERPGTIDLLDSLRERRGRRQRPLTPLEEDEADDLSGPDDEGVAPSPIQLARAERAHQHDAPGALDEDLSDDLADDLADDREDGEAADLDVLGLATRDGGPPPAAHPARSRPELAEDAEVLVLPDAEPVPVRHAARPVGRHPAGSKLSPAAADGSDAGPALDPALGIDTGSEGPARSERLPRRGKRASVPSWDDIVFGARRE